MTKHIIAQLVFGRAPANASETWLEIVEESLRLWFTSMQRNGQVLGDPVCGVHEEVWTAYVRLPAPDALNEDYCTRYTKKYLETLSAHFGQKAEVRLLSEGDSEWTSADWKSSPWLVLLGASIDGLGPIRTSNLSCIPNYRLPLDADEAERLTFWAHSREWHESIWFASGSLEIETYRALADPLSELNLLAANHAWILEKAVKKPVFTVLFRHYALANGLEESRPCPLCGEPWRTQDDQFPYRCEPCRLLGEIAPSGAENGLEWIGTWEARTKMLQPGERWPNDVGKLSTMLRRGHGQGYRQFLHEAPPHAWALLEDCLRHDPRIDRQVENRASYFGQLILETQMPTHRVWRLLREADEEEWLILELVAWLAEKQVPGAFEALIGEILLRKNWQDVLAHIPAFPSPEGNENARRVCQALEDKFPDPSHLAAAVAEAWNANEPLLAPLESHSSGIVRDTSVTLRKQKQDWQNERQHLRQAYASKTMRELIESCDDIDKAYEVGKCAASKVEEEDAAWLVSQLSHGHPARSVASLMALKLVMAEGLFEQVLTFYHEGASQNIRHAVRIRCADVLLTASADKLLPLGRVWIRDQQPELQTVGRKILAQHAETSDIPLLRELLSEGLKDEEHHLYLICDCLTAMTRFPGEGMVEEVLHAYHQMQYSYGRMLAVKAMHTLCPATFREEHARECLYDCEEETREIARKSIEAGDVVSA